MIVAIVIACIIGGIFALKYIQKRLKRKEPWQIDPIQRGTAALDLPYVTTPLGKKVHYEKGLPQNMDLAAMDRGFENAYRKGECQGYPVNREDNHNNVHIVVFESELSPEARTPCYRVPINEISPYFRSPWDMMADSDEKIHYILAAGQMLAVGSPYGDCIIIPHGCNEELICDFENEHIIYNWYDGPKADATNNHQTGGHPIIPSCPGEALGFRPEISILCNTSKPLGTILPV